MAKWLDLFRDQLKNDWNVGSRFGWVVLILMLCVLLPLCPIFLLIFIGAPSKIGALGGFLLCGYGITYVAGSAVAKFKNRHK